MGQYYKIINLDKEEYLYSHSFGNGLKLLEFGASGSGTMCGLAILLADGNNRGGGDLHSDHPIIGSWAGDRIVVAGDYADEGKFLKRDWIRRYCKSVNDIIRKRGKGRKDSEPLLSASKMMQDKKSQPNLYAVADQIFKDISNKVIEAMMEDKWLAEDLIEHTQYLSLSRLAPAIRAKRK